MPSQSLFRDWEPSVIAQSLRPLVSSLESEIRSAEASSVTSTMKSVTASTTSPLTAYSTSTSSSTAASSYSTATVPSSCDPSPTPIPPSASSTPQPQNATAPVPPPQKQSPSTSTTVAISVGIGVPTASLAFLLGAFYAFRKHKARQGYRKQLATPKSLISSPIPSAEPPAYVADRTNFAAARAGGGGASGGASPAGAAGAAGRIGSLLSTAQRSSQSLIRELSRYNAHGSLLHTHDELAEDAEQEQAQTQAQPSNSRRSGLLWNLPYNPFASATVGGPRAASGFAHLRSNSQASVRSMAAAPDAADVQGFDFWCAGDTPPSSSPRENDGAGTSPSRGTPQGGRRGAGGAAAETLLAPPEAAVRYSSSVYSTDTAGDGSVDVDVDRGTLGAELVGGPAERETQYRPHPALSIKH